MSRSIVKKLSSKGVQVRIVVIYLLGEARFRMLTNDERKYIFDYLITLDKKVKDLQKGNLNNK